MTRAVDMVTHAVSPESMVPSPARAGHTFNRIKPTVRTQYLNIMFSSSQVNKDSD
jgi:hypothetical protein